MKQKTVACEKCNEELICYGVYAKKCPKCRKIMKKVYATRYRYKNLKKNRALTKKLARRFRRLHPDLKSQKDKIYRENKKLEKIARNKVNNDIQFNRLARKGECEKCKSSFKVEAHHPDYSKPLIVQWLCRECHLAIHRKYKVNNVNEIENEVFNANIGSF